MPEYEYGTLAEHEADALGAILTQCFYAKDGFWEVYRDRLGVESFRGVRRGDRVVGGLGLISMGQWFGGRSVPMGGIAAVGVPPEERGGGAAESLLTGVLRELRVGGLPISTLYPSNLRLYRKVGYEHAGVSCRYALEAKSLRPGDRELPMTAVDPARHELLHGLHRRAGETAPGTLDRGPEIWKGKVNARFDKPFASLVGDEGDPVGYVLFHQKPKDGGGFDLIVRDQVALTPAARRRLWTFYADHRSLAREVVWDGPTCEPALTLLPTLSWRVRELERWMLRVVDVAGALTARGYPAGVEAEVVLDVADDILPENAGRWRLRVESGRGEVSGGGEGGALSLDVRALAPLYTGFHTAGDLRRFGLLEGDDATVAAAERIFAGPEPWMADHF